jgi:hypothetical protein
MDYLVDESTGRQYLVMNHVAGEDLASIVSKRGPLPEEEAVRWACQVLDALEYLHNQQPPMIHGNVGPANIRLAAQEKAMLANVGVARAAESAAPTAADGRAMAGYTSPEQYGHRCDQRSDVYSLGATLYTLLTGQVPPEAPLLASGLEPLAPPRSLVRGVSPGVEAAVLRAMEPLAAQRFQAAGEMKDVLGGAPGTAAEAAPIRARAGREKPPVSRSTQMIEKPGSTGLGPVSRPRDRFLRLVLGVAALAGLFLIALYGLNQWVPRPAAPTPAAETPSPTPSPMVTPTPVNTPRPTATRTPTPPVVTFLKGQQVYLEDFGGKVVEWPLAIDASVKRFVQDGRYNLQVIPSRLGEWDCPRKIVTNTDMVLEFSARLEDGPETNTYGVLFRFLDNKNFYWLQIAPAGTWELGRMVGGVWSLLISPTASEAIPRGKQPAAVRLAAKGGAFAFFVNGAQLATIADASLPAGGACLSVSARGEGGGRMSFDDLTIWEIAR